MLNELYQRICAHFAPLGLLIWQEDCVPDGTAFPYLTIRIESGVAFGSPGHAEVTVWCRSDAPHSERLALADEVLALVPLSGTSLWVDGSLLHLRHAPGSSVTLGRDGDILFARLRFDLRVYPRHAPLKGGTALV